ncbi:GrpE protein [Magnetococcus marinus MC-1]|uniref:Protein GrpE n=1 Tax=Magnetococcus marinus (strain ATCC BAA-1437 / JCM 17883 / MC-1) TaxID=156889 RepID=A0L4Z1_MAGMM|nr:nucleotide exchange factor GrpE [Magnetococcus marinus]ABK43034.1 GrpE protein [Magnetococcus marinus MC-1]
MSEAEEKKMSPEPESPEPENSESSKTESQAVEGEVVEEETESCTLPEEENSTEPSLEAQLQMALDKAEEQQKNYLRSMADMDNLRKRNAREMEQARKFAVEGFARDMLSVADNLERAMSHMDQESDNEQIKAIVDGVKMVNSELAKSLEKHGIKRIEAMGQMFDPNLHQAVMQVADDRVPPDTVVQEMQAGYTLNERLLRPSMVGVAKAP